MQILSKGENSKSIFLRVVLVVCLFLLSVYIFFFFIFGQLLFIRVRVRINHLLFFFAIPFICHWYAIAQFS